MSTPQNPNSGSEPVNNQNDQADQYAQQEQPPQQEQPAQQEQPVQQEQPAQHEQPAQQVQYEQQNPYAPGAQYDQAAHYGQQQGQYDQTAGYDQVAQPGQPGPYYQGADYTQQNQGVYAGSQHPQAGVYGAPGTFGEQPRSAGFFKALFDIRFDNFIAIRWAGFIYVIAIIVAVLSWLGAIVGGIATGVAAGSAASFYGDDPSFNPLPLLLAIIFGWIIPALWVIFVRLGLEFIVSTVKTAQNTKAISDSLNK